ncbi:hypothetical protein [Desulfitibacter alkalitolerans]|uniref:hypothetical protein n=1 Tax=Desulfitibacter alkalitolerans TaxID=264641 RepID=UPI0005581953|nr:hypothetical protein [Desulfitibacter alkalitolerans]
MKILLLILIIVLVGFAVREKVKQKMKTSSVSGMPEEIKASPVSQALAELVAVAGGIYLSLLMLTTFLGLELPSTMKIISVEIDTIAGIALILTLAQPFIIRISKKFTKR